MTSSKHDVIIIGAGLAGAAAAYRLSQYEKRLLVIEARDRVGGRAFARPFGNAADAELLEYGGSWITPMHHRIRAYVKEFGLQLRPRAPVRERHVMQGGHPGLLSFASDDTRLAHERAIARIAADALILKAGREHNEKGEALTGLSYAQYMARLSPPEVTRHVQDSWWVASGGGPMDEISAGEFLHSCAYETGLAESMIDAWADTVEPSMAALTARLIEASGADVLFSSPVKGVEQDDHSVRVTLQSNITHEASHAIFATGLNPLRNISFSPPLPDLPRTAVAKGQRGRAFKLWIRARGVPVGRHISGDGSGVQMLFAERMGQDGSTLLIGFGIQDETARPGDPAWVRAQFAKLCPNAEYLGHDWHDWITDPFAQGTWLSTPYDMAEAFASEAWSPQGRIAFASSDIAAEDAGWFEGAVKSGEAAAAWVAKMVKVSST